MLLEFRSKELRPRHENGAKCELAQQFAVTCAGAGNDLWDEALR